MPSSCHCIYCRDQSSTLYDQRSKLKARRNPVLYRKNATDKRKDKKKKAREQKAKQKTRQLRESSVQRHKELIFQEDMERSGVDIADYETGQKFRRKIRLAAGVGSKDSATVAIKKLGSWINENLNTYRQLIKDASQESRLKIQERLQKEELSRNLRQAQLAQREEQQKRKHERQMNWNFIAEAWQESESDIKGFVEEWVTVYGGLNAEELRRQLRKRRLSLARKKPTIATRPPQQSMPTHPSSQPAPPPLQPAPEHPTLPQKPKSTTPPRILEPKSLRTIAVPHNLPKFLIDQMHASGGHPEETGWVFGDSTTAAYFEETIDSIMSSEGDTEKTAIPHNILILGGMLKDIPQWMHDSFNVKHIERSKRALTVSDIGFAPDLIIVFIRFASHNLYYSATALAAQLEIPLLAATNFSDAILRAQENGIDWFVEIAIDARSHHRARHFRRNPVKKRNPKKPTNRRVYKDEWEVYRADPEGGDWERGMLYKYRGRIRGYPHPSSRGPIMMEGSFLRDESPYYIDVNERSTAYEKEIEMLKKGQFDELIEGSNLVLELLDLISYRTSSLTTLARPFHNKRIRKQLAILLNKMAREKLIFLKRANGKNYYAITRDRLPGEERYRFREQELLDLNIPLETTLPPPPPNKKPLSKETKQQILEICKDITLDRHIIARDFDITYGTVSKICKGIKKFKMPRGSTIPEEVDARVIELCHMGLTNHEIAIEVGFPQITVATIRRKAGISLP